MSSVDPLWFTRGKRGERGMEARDLEPPCILLAEDNAEMRKFLGAELRKDGYEVIEASTGSELVDLIADHLLYPVTRPAIDLIIADLRMPGFTGMEILGALRAEEWVTPFILMTAFGGDEVRAEALRAGAAAVFDKPFEMDDLRTAVVNLVGRVPPRVA